MRLHEKNEKYFSKGLLLSMLAGDVRMKTTQFTKHSLTNKVWRPTTKQALHIC